MTTPPGWYPDPWATAPSRWWDGVQWTAHVGGYPPPDPAAGRDRLLAVWNVESRMWQWARAAVAGYGVAVIAEAVLFFVFGREIHRFIHGFRAVQNDGGFTTPKLHVASVFGLDGIVELLLVAVAVLFLIWQYNAASTARALNYPSRLSPGLGVGSWFIPIVNVWFPYQALIDCLHPAHPRRSRGIWAWLAYILATFLVSTTYLVAIFSLDVSIVVGLVALASALLAVSLGVGLVTAINEDHRRALQSML